MTAANSASSRALAGNPRKSAGQFGTAMPDFPVPSIVRTPPYENPSLFAIAALHASVPFSVTTCAPSAAAR